MIETQIIQGCKELNPKHQRQLVNDYSGVLYTVARRYCGEGHLAKDALQEGLIKIFKHIGRYDSKKGRFTAWMKKIVANESLRLLAKELKLVADDIDEIDIINLNPTIIDHLNGEELIAVIQSIPLGYREVFNMYVIDGYNHNEIGEKLGITSSSSRSKLSRAKKMIQRKLSMEKIYTYVTK